jgi:hypothetical protein
VSGERKRRGRRNEAGNELADAIRKFLDAPAEDRAVVVVSLMRLFGYDAAASAAFCEGLGERFVRTAKAIRISHQLPDAGLERDVWMRGFTVALAETHRLLTHAREDAGLCRVARDAGLTLAEAQRVGVDERDVDQLRKIGVS